MDNANIFFVEDDEDLAGSLSEVLLYRGHKVVLRATTLEEALRIIDTGQLQEKKVNLAIIDANFPEAKRRFEVFGGPIVAKAVRDSGQSIKVIAFTGLTAAEATYGDVYADKADSLDHLFETVASL